MQRYVRADLGIAQAIGEHREVLDRHAEARMEQRAAVGGLTMLARLLMRIGPEVGLITNQHRALLSS